VVRRSPRLGCVKAPDRDQHFDWQRDCTSPPVGQRLNPTGPTGVYVVRPDGTDITQISSCGTECRITSIQWASDGKRLAYVGSTPDTFKNDTMTSSIDIADTMTGSVDLVWLRTHTSQSDEDWITPAITWAPSGQHLAVIARRPGKPTTLYTVRAHQTTMSAPAPIRAGAYPPLAWLPTPESP
jgi:Tol biopolymer transport system component